MVGQFTALFRTDDSEPGTFSGFEMYVICYYPGERDLPGMHAIYSYPHDNHYHYRYATYIGPCVMVG